MKPEKPVADRQSICEYVRYLAKQRMKEWDGMPDDPDRILSNNIYRILSNNLYLLADLIETEADKIERE